MASKYNELKKLARKEGKHTNAEWEEMKRVYRFHCIRCKRKCRRARLTKDHILPLSRGGSDSITNIQPMCRKCNTRKGSKSYDYRPLWKETPAYYLPSLVEGWIGILRPSVDSAAVQIGTLETINQISTL